MNRKAGRRRATKREFLRGLERLESRHLMANDLANLSDEFNDASSIAGWQRVEQVEGWNIDQLNRWDVNTTAPGAMTMRPESVVWYQDWRGPLAFKQVTGDFVVTTRITVRDRDDVGDSDADDIPDGAAFSLGGLMIRTPRPITHGAADWVTGSFADDGTNNGENYVFLSLGHATDGTMQLEVKTTRNSNSQLQLSSAGGATEADLQIARIGSSIITLVRLPGQDWRVHQRYSRPDMPATLQVGMVSYSDWNKASDFAPLFHNSHVLNSATTPNPTPSEPYAPDLDARFDFARYVRPQLPAALVGLDVAQSATDSQLLSFLGAAANLPADPPPPDNPPDGPPVDPPADQTGSISGHVFRDLNQNGVRDGVPTSGGDAGGDTGTPSDPGSANDDFHFVVYDDEVVNDWRVEATTTTVDTQAAAFTHTGDASLAVTFNGNQAIANLVWNGVFPRTLRGYDELRFWVHGGETSGQRFRLGFNTVDYSWIGGPYFEVPSNGWTEVVMPWSAVGSPDAIRSIMFLSTGGAQSTFYVDDIALVGVGTAADRPAVPRAPDWGVNLFYHADWSFDGAFTDVSKTFRAWGLPDQPWVHPQWSGVTDQGVPTEDFGALFMLRGYDNGIYRLRYSGSAQLQVGGWGRVVAGSQRSASGFNYVDIEVGGVSPVEAPNFDAPSVFLSWRGVSGTNPVRDIRLMAPGYDFNTTQVYTDAFLHRMQPFSTIRTMQFTDTNFSPAADWNVRRLPGETIQTAWQDPRGGLAWEYVVDLANESNKDIWINVPGRADDNYVRQLARLWSEHLEPGRKVYVELSNELWNWSYAQTHDYNSDFYNRVAPRVRGISDIFHQEFAADRSRVEIVLAGQAAWDVHLAQGLQYFVDNNLAPADYIDAVAIAPYFGLSSNQTTETADQILDRLADLDGQRWMMRQNERIADYYGLKLYAYEGGPHIELWQFASQDVFWEVQNSPRMGEILRDYVDAWQEVGGGLFAEFAFTGGSWGLLDSIKHPGSVKWDGLMSAILPGGDATLDHDVDFADFTVLSGHFGQANQWWEQGDFTADNVVDGADLVTLYTNLNVDELTAAQREEIETFAAAHGVVLPGKPGGGNGGGTGGDGNGGGIPVDTAEPPLEGVFVFVDVDSDGQYDADEPSTLTDAEGMYRFLELVPGQYSIQIVLQREQALSTPAGGAHVLFVAPGADETGVDFGVVDAQEDELLEVSIDGAPTASPEGTQVNVAANILTDDSLENLVYNWSVSRNGAVIATGSTSTLSFTPDDNGAYVVQLTVDDSFGNTASSEATIDVTNVAPQSVAIGAAPVALVGRELRLTSSFVDPGAADTHTVAWEVRRGTQLVASGNGSQWAFTPSNTGTFVVSLTVTDDDGGATSTSAQVEVRSAVLEADPTRPGQTVLYVTGGAGADVMQVQRTSLAGGAGGVIVRLNNRTEGQFAMPSRIVVQGGAGDDRISLDSRVTAIAELFGEAGNDQLCGSINDDLLDGGDGNDVIYGGAGRDRIYGGAGDDAEYGEAGDDHLDGGSGNDRLFGGVGDDVIVGGTGEDLLSGQAGRNVLIGGAGADTLEGGVDEDLLIGGSTAFDANATALAAVLSEWQSAGDFATRVARLRTGLPTGQRLRWNDTVFDDFAADSLTGGAGRDWHFARPTDSIRGLRAEDRVE